MAVRAWWVVAVAWASASAWQRVACNPETLPADRVLALLCCSPLHLLARLAAFLFVPFLPARASLPLPTPRRYRHPHHLLLPPPELVIPQYSHSLYSSSSSSSDEDDDDYGDIEDGDRIDPHID